MSLLLPQEVSATVRSARPVDIHGDRYVDVTLEIEGANVRTGRVPASDCPPDLAPGDQIRARFVMGVMVSVKR
ncbi:MAG: hypothetical protein ACRENS_01380 [Candidatus Eiseniibacteriota bacterium]